MSTLGLIGGIGPESTIDYYRQILATVRARRPGTPAPRILIDSLDVDHGIALLNANRLSDLADYIAGSAEALARAGADFAAIAANTPHLVFDDVARRSRVPLISIVRATAARARSLSLNKVALLGTGFTMRARFYPDEFERAGIGLATPNEEERDFIHGKYIGELLRNEFLPETRDAILQIVRRLQSDEDVQAVVLAGTELPLLLRGSEPEGLPFLDTTTIHVEAIVDALQQGA